MDRFRPFSVESAHMISDVMSIVSRTLAMPDLSLVNYIVLYNRLIRGGSIGTIFKIYSCFKIQICLKLVKKFAWHEILFNFRDTTLITQFLNEVIWERAIFALELNLAILIFLQTVVPLLVVSNMTIVWWVWLYAIFSNDFGLPNSLVVC